MKIYELNNKVWKDLKKKNLVTAYRKAKKFIENGHGHLVSLKIRNPKSMNITQFRINKQFRAFAKRQGDTLVVFSIYNHQ